MSKIIYKDKLQEKYIAGTILSDDIKASTINTNTITSDSSNIDVLKSIDLNGDITTTGDITSNKNVINNHGDATDINFLIQYNDVNKVSVNNNGTITTKGNVYIGNSSEATIMNSGLLTTKNDIREIQNNKGVRLHEDKIQKTTDNGQTWSDLSFNEVYNAGKQDENNGEIFNDYENNNASGNYSHAEGYNTNAAADYSFAGGSGSSTSGTGVSFAFGLGCQANGYRSCALNNYTKATNDCSFAIGNHTESTGVASISGGHFTKAENTCETVIGKYNIINPEGGAAVNNNKIFVVGNGTADNSRSDAFIVKDTGETIINNVLRIEGTESLGDGDGVISIVNGGSTRMFINHSGSISNRGNYVQKSWDGETTVAQITNGGAITGKTITANNMLRIEGTGLADGTIVFSVINGDKNKCTINNLGSINNQGNYYQMNWNGTEQVASVNNSGEIIGKKFTANGTISATGAISGASLNLNSQKIYCGTDTFQIFTYSNKDSPANYNTPVVYYSNTYDYIIYNDKIKINIPFGDGSANSHNKFIFSKRCGKNLNYTFDNQIIININLNNIKTLLDTLKPAGTNTQFSQDNIGTCFLKVNYAKNADAGTPAEDYNNYYRYYIEGNTSYDNQYPNGIMLILKGQKRLSNAEDKWFEFDNLESYQTSGVVITSYWMKDPQIKDYQNVSIEIKYKYV